MNCLADQKLIDAVCWRRQSIGRRQTQIRT